VRKQRKDSQSAEAIGRTQYIREGHARWGDSEFENDGDEEKMRGIPPLGDVAVVSLCCLSGGSHCGSVMIL
jgi:hypothetical protein